MGILARPGFRAGFPAHPAHIILKIFYLKVPKSSSQNLITFLCVPPRQLQIGLYQFNMKLHNIEPHPNPPRLRSGNRIFPSSQAVRGIKGWGKILCS